MGCLRAWKTALTHSVALQEAIIYLCKQQERETGILVWAPRHAAWTSKKSSQLRSPSTRSTSLRPRWSCPGWWKTLYECTADGKTFRHLWNLGLCIHVVPPLAGHRTVLRPYCWDFLLPIPAGVCRFSAGTLIAALRIFYWSECRGSVGSLTLCPSLHRTVKHCIFSTVWNRNTWTYYYKQIITID